MADHLKLAGAQDSGAQMIDGVRIPTEITMRLVAELLPYAKNTKKHGPRQIEAIAASMREVGFTNPVLVADGGILAGHGRILAAQKVGLKRVPTIDLSHLDETQRRALVIWDNRSAELDTSWDLEMLKLETDDLRAIGLDLETATGFSEEALAKLFEGMEEPEPDGGGADPDDVPDVPAEPMSQLGDVWVIGDGEHKVMCGSSLEASSWDVLMGNEDADLVFTDPPYGVSVGEKNDSIAKAQGRTNKTGSILNDDLQDDDLYKFLLPMFQRMFERMKPGASIYVYHADSQGIAFRTAFRDAGFRVRGCLIWKKNTFSLGRSDHQWIHEPCLFAWKEGAKHRWFGGRKQSTFFDLGEKNPFTQMEDGRWKVTVGDETFIVSGDATVEHAPGTIFNAPKPARSELHPTQKPVDLCRKHLRNSARPGDIVIDAFGGSGSTAVAAHLERMKSRLVELDPRYVDVIVRRMQTMTGLRAVHAVTGELFPAEDEPRQAAVDLPALPEPDLHPSDAF
jgi:DNA modification methylase